MSFDISKHRIEILDIDGSIYSGSLFAYECRCSCNRAKVYEAVNLSNCVMKWSTHVTATAAMEAEETGIRKAIMELQVSGYKRVAVYLEERFGVGGV